MRRAARQPEPLGEGTGSRRGAGLSEKLLSQLYAQGPLPLETLQQGVGAPRDEVRAALQREALRGRVIFDLAKGRYRPRALMAQPVADDAVRYGSPREARAHRLLNDGDSVEITKLHEVSGEGIEISGEVNDRESRRKFSPRF